MIRLAIRQFRPSAITAAIALAALVIVAAVTGPQLAHLYDTSGIGTCSKFGDCTQLEAAFLIHDAFLEALLNFLVIVVPAIIGIFFGAPLVARELETGTHRLAWAQSVSRTRWLITKLGVVGVASMLCAAVVSITVTWWSSPIDRVNMSPFSMFDQRDLAPVAYAAFAFALGVALGTIIGRVLPAMAATLAGFVALRLIVYKLIRPHLLSPLHLVTALRVSNGPGVFTNGTLNPADWVLSDQTINASGLVIGQSGGTGSNGSLGFSVASTGHVSIPGAGVCPGLKISQLALGPGGPGPASQKVQAALHNCITNLHLREVLTYQPADRYWPFQLLESGIFIAIALVLCGSCVWWTRRRLS